MEVMTRRSEEEAWDRWPSVTQALQTCAEAPETRVLLYSVDPQTELQALTAAVRLLRRVIAPTTPIAVASPHPAEGWIAAARAAGADCIWLVSAPEGRLPGRLKFDVARDLREPACPALHVRTTQGCTLSVCGHGRDRLVLDREHLLQRCVGAWDDCPHAAADPERKGWP